MKNHRISAAAVVLFTLGACAESPTLDDSARPGGASYDSGYTIGSGGGVSSGGGFVVGSGNDGANSTTTTTSPQEAERNGYTIGSGGS